MKIDAFHNIQLTSVYKGHRRLSPDEIYAQYNGLHVDFEHMSGFLGGVSLFVYLFIYQNCWRRSCWMKFFTVRRWPEVEADRRLVRSISNLSSH